MYIGVDIGGTKCAVVLGDPKGDRKVLKKVKFPTLGVDETIARITAEVEKMMPCDAIGISCGGPLDEKRGIIMSPPNLPEWDNIHITDILKDKFGVPVRLLNDANACAVAEWKYGAGRGAENMIFLTFGTGLGAGLILGSKLYSGACGMAGEVGHIRLAEEGPIGYGKAGSFEGFCSGGGIARAAKDIAKRAKEAGRVAFSAVSDEEIDALTAAEIARLARLGDPDAKALFNECGRRLGQGLAILADILNPEKIVIGSIYQRCSDLLCEQADQVLSKEALGATYSRLSVVPAELGDEIGDLAALAVASEIFN